MSLNSLCGTYLFSDETYFDVNNIPRAQYVRRYTHERITANHTTSHRPFLRRILFWGCFSGAGGPGPLIHIDGTMNSERYKQVLTDHLLPYRTRHFRNGRAVFQHDNAPCHQSQETTSFLQRRQITLLPWPPYSPDLNPIENIWGYVKLRVHKRTYSNKNELIASVENVWNSDEIRDLCSRLCESMPDRIQECIRNRGGYTSY